MVVYIYGLYCPRTGVLRYVGKTIRLKARLTAHLTESPHTHRGRWIASLLREGMKPEMRTLEVIDNSNDLDWQDRERWWIEAGRLSGDALTNLDSGGKSGMKKGAETCERIRQAKLGLKQSPELVAKRAAAIRGSRRSPETRALLSQKAQERETRRRALHPPKPKIKKERAPVTDETRANMRAAHLGQTLTDAHRAALSEAQTKRWSDPAARARLSATLTGITRSPETRAKMSKAKTGEVHSPERRARNSAVRTGSHHTSETIAKMCRQQKARCAAPEAREKLRQAAIARWSRKKLTSPA